MNTQLLIAFRIALCAMLMFSFEASITMCPASAALSGQIAGTVVDSVSHKALEGVKVVAAAPSGTYTATTDANGRFSIVGVVPDTYKVSFSLTRYDDIIQDGVTVVADTPQTLNVALVKTLTEIAHVSTHARARVTRDTEDSYTVNAGAITQLQGKANDTDEKSLLQKLPSVTLDKNGTVFIRGGDPFQVGYQLDGVDTTVANRTLQNKDENVGNFDLLNGIGAAQLIPGGGDASHGDSGTGLVSLTAKRGTNPGFTNLDFEAVSFPYNHQFTAETGGATANGRFSYYVSFTGVRQTFQYGAPGTPGAELGIFTDSTSLTSINGANSVGVITTAADQQSNDLLGNFFYKFGKNNSQYVQFLVQNQIVRQGENYNGFTNLCYASCNPAGNYLSGGVTGTDPELQAIVPLYPGQKNFYQNVGSEDAIYSPFDLDKIEYGNNINATTYAVARIFQTSSNQIENRPSIGIDNPSNGGTRSGLSAELDKQLGKHFLQFGGQYEYVDPYGTLEDVTDYTYGYFGGAGNVSPSAAVPTSAQCLQASGCLPTAPVAYDFLNAAGADCNMGKTPGTISFTGGGINLSGASPTNPASFTENVPCGYLSKYFPGGIPRLPGEVESPMTTQQIYGYYGQDRFTLGANATVQAGLRLDGYNFLFPDDPQNPESISTVRHQRLFEPHVGITRLFGPRDSIRATYGRTLSIPLPGLSGNSIDRSAFAAFDNVPSYNNLTGMPATYCGLQLNTLCKNYADQLFWLTRDVRFPNSDLAPLRGSTFTNYDFTYSHVFPNGVSFGVTPFYRRGYDIVEQSNTLSFTEGVNPQPIVRPALESNLGIQKSTGIEAVVTYDHDPGLSFRLSGTYLNQIGNDPPLDYLSTPSLLLGTLYRSQLFAPFQGTAALSYRTGIVRINPVFTYSSGYPYGVGSLVAVFLPDGKPAYVQNTNLASSLAGNTPECYVDPEYSGTVTSPNVAACSGSPERSSAGGLLSQGSVNADLTITLHAPNSRNTFGVKITNLFDQLYGIPVPNPYFTDLIETGVYGPNSGVKPGTSPSNPSSPTNGAPAAFPPSSLGSYPYLLFPNRPPLEARFFYQVQL